ncbi:MAG: DUF4157 domain-containing protein, partial [Myxococcota bacterium]|nr:DUF4157 domain-containing protein [Myxococcota bacterium]
MSKDPQSTPESTQTTEQSTERTRSGGPTSGGSSRVQLKGRSYRDQAAALSPEGADGFEAQQANLRPDAQPVQLKGDGGQGGGIHDLAAQGTQGSGGALPHLDAIQTAFGTHDVSGVQAHTGSAAQEASKAMGARAYASGNDVAFGSGATDLHTAAHEAAHIVQQRGGVSLDGGVGQAGDAYEQHADAVADLVVQGQSAEGLLDQHAGGGGAGTQMAVQRDDEENLSNIEQLREALDGWGADASKVHGILRRCSSAEKQQILGDASLKSKLADKLGREDMLSALEILNAPLRDRLTAAMDGWGCDAKTILRLTANASDAEKQGVLADGAMVTRLASELSREDMLTLLANLGAPLADR